MNPDTELGLDGRASQPTRLSWKIPSRRTAQACIDRDWVLDQPEAIRDRHQLIAKVHSIKHIEELRERKP